MSNFIVCMNCGIEKQSRYKTTKFCCDKCRNAYRLKTFKYKLKCIRCNKNFEAIKEHTKYCSDECRKKPENEKAKGNYYNCVPKVNKSCVNCQNEFVVSQNSTKKYCSYECSYAFKVKQKPIHNIKCKECSSWFSSTNKRKVYCSEDCCDRYQDRKKETLRRKRIKQNGKVDWTISIERLIVRDKGKCYLCGEKVNMNIDPNDDTYPSIEHVMPVAKGGTHTWNNVKLAHRKCNYLKADKVLCPPV